MARWYSTISASRWLTGGLCLLLLAPGIEKVRADQETAEAFYRQMVELVDERQFDQVESIATQRLADALHEQSQVWESASHAVLGLLATRREEYVIAIDHLETCLAMPAETFQEICTMPLAEVRWRLGQFSSAAELLLQLGTRYGEAGDQAGQANIWNNLGIIHADSGDAAQAEFWFRRALEAYTELDDVQHMAFSLGNLAKLSHEQGKLAQARDLIDQALAIAETLDSPRNLAQQLHVSGSIHTDEGELDQALQDFESALQFSRTAGHRGEAAHTQTEMARVLIMQGQPAAAVAILEESLEVLVELGLLRYQLDAHRLLRQALTTMGRFEQALDQALQEVALMRALVDEEQARELARMESIYRIEDAERRLTLSAAEAELAEAELQRQRGLMVSLALGVALLFSILALLLVRVRERSRYERRAFDRERQFRQDFSAMLVHDLRGPLQGIMLSVEQIQDKSGDSEVAGLAGQGLDACDEMIGLINDLLRFSKSESERLDLTIEPVELAACIERAVAALRPQAQEKRVHFNLELEKLPPLPVDESRLRQVINNLLANAIRHSPPGGVIALQLSRQGEGDKVRQCLRVVDQGPGIPEQDIKRIFQPYVRAGKQVRSADGFGLGLAISRLIVRAHGGEISASNHHPGACFEICLPEAGRG
jgi:two-component system, OmpR family, sensor histidine kinase BaeS